MDPTLDPDDVAEIDALLRAAVNAALDTTDFKLALERYRALMPEVAPNLASQMPPTEEAQRMLAFATLREVWNRVPRPDNDWRPLPLPKPERNGPCPCGSGQKYKQCCGSMTGMAPFGGEALSVLSYVLERVPAGEYAALPFRKLSPEELGHVAEQWLQQDRASDAVALLEPLLANPAKLDARHEYAFDMLCDAYLDLGAGDERMRLVEALMQVPDRALKCAAMHRRCTMLADEDDYPAAWKLFKEAQRIDPDNPSLAHLEVTLLMSQGDMAQAQARARFWAERMRKLGHGGEGIVDLMDQVARDPDALAAVFGGGDSADGTGPDPQALALALAQLGALIEALPAPASHYRLQPQDTQGGYLEADSQLAAVELEWGTLFTAFEDVDGAGGDVWADTGWLDWLAGHGLAWQSFVVLEDVVLAIGDAPCDDDELNERLDAWEEALLDRAVALLRLNLAAHGGEGWKLEWGWTENRPALRLLGQRIDLAEGPAEELPLLEWIVLTLNPNDNQGFRERLVHAYAANGRAAEALSVCDRYADDGLGAMVYGRILALYLLQRRGDAVAALVHARKQFPRILKMLTAARPRMPDLGDGMLTPGGDDEAWYYRQSWLDLWHETGALDWLKQVAGVKS